MKRLALTSCSLAFVLFATAACTQQTGTPDTTPELSEGMAPGNVSIEEVQRLSRLARDSEDPVELTEYARHPNMGVRSEAAKNPALPVEIQIELVNDPDGLVRNYLGANPQLDDEVAAALVDDPDQRARRTVALNPNVPERILVNFIRDEALEVQKVLARNTSLSREMLLRIANESDPGAVIVLLQRDNLTEDVMEAIRARPEQAIQDALERRAAGEPVVTDNTVIEVSE